MKTIRKLWQLARQGMMLACTHMLEVEMTRNDHIKKYLKVASKRLADGCNLESERQQ